MRQTVDFVGDFERWLQCLLTGLIDETITSPLGYSAFSQA